MVVHPNRNRECCSAAVLYDCVISSIFSPRFPRVDFWARREGRAFPRPAQCKGAVAARLERQWQRDELPEAIRELVLDDQRLRNDICWSVIDCYARVGTPAPPTSASDAVT
jgi:hypothetical protein